MTVTHLATGDYEVQDVECQKCSVALGWTYLKAFSEVCTPQTFSCGWGVPCSTCDLGASILGVASEIV